MMVGQPLDTATKFVAAGIGGAVQRLAWEQSIMIGLGITAALGVVGAAIDLYTRDGLVHKVGDGLLASSGAVTGWVGYEKMFLTPPGTKFKPAQNHAIAGFLPAGQQAVQAMGDQQGYPEFNGLRLNSQVAN
jgi:hypothetical protein